MDVSKLNNFISRIKTKPVGISVLSLLGVTLAYSNLAPVVERPFVAGQILVAPAAGLSEDQLNRILEAQGGRTKKSIHQIGVRVISVPAGAEAAVVRALSHNPQIKFAELDYISNPTYIANDPYNSRSSAWHLTKINAPIAWDTARGAGTTIALLDGGVDCTHPDLVGNCIPGWNTSSNSSDTSPVNPHGTACASTAAAVGDNALGFSGVSFQSKIMPVRVTDDPKGGASCSQIASAINYAADRGARVASMSYWVSGCSTVDLAKDYLWSKNGVLVLAAGNCGSDPLNCTPSTPGSQRTDSGNFAHDIITSATISDDSLAVFSNFGALVDVSAPGYNVNCIWDGGYSSCWGTSFSTPVTAGVLALILSANPDLTIAQAQSILYSTSKDLGAAGWDQYFGHGRIDAAAAVQAALATTPATDTKAPNVTITSPGSGSTIKGVIAVNTSANDDTAVVKVDLYANGTLVASDVTSPYYFSLDTNNFSDGPLSLQAKASDAAGNVGNSGTVNVTIQNIVIQDTVAPTVSISNPKNGSTVSGNVRINASATDNVGVTSMSLYIDGQLKATSSTSSISSSWNTRKVSKGAHTIRVDARDAAGNSSSTTISVNR